MQSLSILSAIHGGRARVTTPLPLIAAERDQDWDWFSGAQHSAFEADIRFIDYINFTN